MLRAAPVACRPTPAPNQHPQRWLALVCSGRLLALATTLERSHGRLDQPRVEPAAGGLAGLAAGHGDGLGDDPAGHGGEEEEGAAEELLHMLGRIAGRGGSGGGGGGAGGGKKRPPPAGKKRKQQQQRQRREEWQDSEEEAEARGGGGSGASGLSGSGYSDSESEEDAGEPPAMPRFVLSVACKVVPGWASSPSYLVSFYQLSRASAWPTLSSCNAPHPTLCMQEPSKIRKMTTGRPARRSGGCRQSGSAAGRRPACRPSRPRRTPWPWLSSPALL